MGTYVVAGLRLLAPRHVSGVEVAGDDGRAAVELKFESCTLWVHLSELFLCAVADYALNFEALRFVLAVVFVVSALRVAIGAVRVLVGVQLLFRLHHKVSISGEDL